MRKLFPMDKIACRPTLVRKTAVGICDQEITLQELCAQAHITW